jgi:hypothetical protein
VLSDLLQHHYVNASISNLRPSASFAIISGPPSVAKYCGILQSELGLYGIVSPTPEDYLSLFAHPLSSIAAESEDPRLNFSVRPCYDDEIVEHRRRQESYNKGNIINVFAAPKQRHHNKRSSKLWDKPPHTEPFLH